MPAIKSHSTGTTDAAWDGGKNEKNLKEDQDQSYYEKMYAWRDPDADPTTKSAYKFPHHMVDSDGNIGDANIKACQSIISILNGGMGGANIPDSDRQGVYNHAAKHLRDAGLEPAELKSRTGNPGREVRYLTEPVEIRTISEGDQQQEVIEGYALKFNRWSEAFDFWIKFREKIDPKALDEADMTDVVALFNHDASMPLARSTIKSNPGKLELVIDNIGLKYRFAPTDTSYAADLKTNLRAGVISKSSFAFSLDYDNPEAESWEYNEADDIWERTIKKFQKIYDVSPVTYPAYNDTESVIGARSLEKVEGLKRSLKKAEEQPKNNWKITILRKKLDILNKF